MEHTNATTDATLTESLSAVDNTDDPRSESMKISMAEHFGDYEYEYREDPHTDAEVVYEDDRVIVVADHTGHELNEWVSDFNMTEADTSICILSVPLRRVGLLYPKIRTPRRSCTRRGARRDRLRVPRRRQFARHPCRSVCE